MGPMRAACRFARELEPAGLLERMARVQVDLYGSLALTGLGHGTDRAVLLGLAGNEPASIDPAAIESTVAAIRASRQHRARRQAGDRIRRAARPGLSSRSDVSARSADAASQRAALHRFRCCRVRSSSSARSFPSAADSSSRTELPIRPSDESEVRLPYPFHSAAELLEVARAHSLSIDRVMLANECERLRAGRSQRDPTSVARRSGSHRHREQSGKPCKRAPSAAWLLKAFCPAA